MDVCLAIAVAIVCGTCSSRPLTFSCAVNHDRATQHPSAVSLQSDPPGIRLGPALLTVSPTVYATDEFQPGTFHSETESEVAARLVRPAATQEGFKGLQKEGNM